jgi:hypothetical protein
VLGNMKICAYIDVYLAKKYVAKRDKEYRKEYRRKN